MKAGSETVKRYWITYFLTREFVTAAKAGGVAHVARPSWISLRSIRATRSVGGPTPERLCRRARLHQLVDDRIHQRLERSVDNVGRHPDRGPALAVLVLAFDQHARHGLGAGVEDADPVVGEIEPLDVGLVLAEIFAQREVERVDRAVAFRRRDELVVADGAFDHRHADRHPLADGVDALL